MKYETFADRWIGFAKASGVDPEADSPQRFVFYAGAFAFMAQQVFAINAADPGDMPAMKAAYRALEDEVREYLRAQTGAPLSH